MNISHPLSAMLMIKEKVLGSVRSQTFFNPRERKSVNESLNSSLFLEGRKIPDYCSFLYKFKDMQENLQKYAPMINQLHLIYQTVDMI